MGTRAAVKLAKQWDAKVQTIYGQRCSGIQVDVMDISKVFGVGRAAIMAGGTDEEVGNAIAAFVETIRKN